MVEEHLYEDRLVLFQSLGSSVAESLIDAVRLRSQASLLLSGGSTPQALYEYLAQQPLPWQQIACALVDERWVPIDHPRSNEAFIRSTLLHTHAREARLTGMYHPISPDEALPRIEAAYRQLPSPFDITILGMGEDGHTASLFPKAKGLAAALDRDNPSLCATIQATASEVTGAELQRVSLTLNGILGSRQLFLILLGKDKLRTYREAEQYQGDYLDSPISAVIHQSQTRLQLYWAP